MSDLGGFRVCGRRGGDSFSQAVRLDSASKCAKEGFVRCSEKTSLDTTICVKDLRDCPITWIKWAETQSEVDKITEAEGETVSVRHAGEYGFLLFSKEVDSLPVISIKMS